MADKYRFILSVLILLGAGYLLLANTQSAAVTGAIFAVITYWFPKIERRKPRKNTK